MSVMYCEKHNIRWDSDISDSCVRCETDGHYFQEKCSVCGDYYPYPVGLHHSQDECVAIATKVGVQACREGDRTMLASDAGNELLKKVASALTAQQEPVAKVKRNSGVNGREFVGETLEFRDLPVGTRLYTAPASGVKEGMLLDALQRAQRVMHGEGVEDQGEAWDKCAQILDEAITHAAGQVNAESCTRSHPHENMSVECERKTDEARENNVRRNAELGNAPHSASQPDTVAVPRECNHDWRIWPETDGYEQRCSKCKAYRNTPQEVRDAVIKAAQEGK